MRQRCPTAPRSAPQSTLWCTRTERQEGRPQVLTTWPYDRTPHAACHPRASSVLCSWSESAASVIAPAPGPIGRSRRVLNSARSEPVGERHPHQDSGRQVGQAEGRTGGDGETVAQELPGRGRANEVSRPPFSAGVDALLEILADLLHSGAQPGEETVGGPGLDHQVDGVASIGEHVLAMKGPRQPKALNVARDGHLQPRAVVAVGCAREPLASIVVVHGSLPRLAQVPPARDHVKGAPGSGSN